MNVYMCTHFKHTLYSYTTGTSALPDINAQGQRRVHLYRQSTSAHCITVMYHSPNRWGESHKTAATLIKAFLTSIVGDRA